MLQDRNGALWFGALDGGVSRYDREGRGSSGPSGTGIFTTFTVKDGMADDIVQAIFEDRDGNVWIGSPRRAEPV